MQSAQIYHFINVSYATKMILEVFGWSTIMNLLNVDIYRAADHASMKIFSIKFNFHSKFTLLLQIVKVCAVLRHRRVVMAVHKTRMEHQRVHIDHQQVQHRRQIIAIRMMWTECKMMDKLLVLYSKTFVATLQKKYCFFYDFFGTIVYLGTIVLSWKKIVIIYDIIGNFVYLLGHKLHPWVKYFYVFLVI